MSSNSNENDGSSEKKSGSAKKGCGVVVLAFFALGVLGHFLPDTESSKPGMAQSTPATSAAARIKTDLRQGYLNGTQVEVVTVSAMNLFREYDRNEVATDIRLKGKIVEIQGTVTGINKDFWDSVYVKLKTPNEFMPATVRPIDSEIEKIARLQKRQSVTFRCEKMQRFAGSPSGSKCVLMD